MSGQTNGDPTMAMDSQMASAIAEVGALDWRFDPPISLESNEYFGKYEGLPPRVELLADGRRVRLLSDISYISIAPWPVPGGVEVDGASIPWPLWSLIGGPFEGRYRDASIIHDHYCRTRTRAWRDVHRMFHDAMRCSGVGRLKAKILFYAVYRFGPRWDIGLEATSAPAVADRLTGHTAPSFAADSTAIYRHDLNLDEIERLADWRATSPGPAATTLEGFATEAPTSLARLLSIPGGSGTAEDVEAIIARAAFLPDFVLNRFNKKGVRIIACRDSVTDFERSLRGVIPRGWEQAGKTWDDVPGAYLPARNRVVVATIAKGAARVVPDKSVGSHGSVDLLVHEALHGFDFASGHAALHEPRFRDARQSDFVALDAYEKQAGDAGLQETFAESGARFMVEPAALAASWPALHRYWLSGPTLDARIDITESPDVSTGAIGTIQRTPEGSIALDLRADGEGGAIGHARFVFYAGDDRFDALKQRLDSHALESPGTDPGAPLLFYP